MKFSAGLLFASLCVFACIDLFVVSANEDLRDLKLKDVEQILSEAGVSPARQGRFLLTGFSTAGLRAFVDAWNTALAALVTSKVP